MTAVLQEYQMIFRIRIKNPKEFTTAKNSSLRKLRMVLSITIM